MLTGSFGLCYGLVSLDAVQLPLESVKGAVLITGHDQYVSLIWNACKDH